MLIRGHKPLDIGGQRQIVCGQRIRLHRHDRWQSGAGHIVLTIASAGTDADEHLFAGQGHQFELVFRLRQAVALEVTGIEIDHTDRGEIEDAVQQTGQGIWIAGAGNRLRQIEGQARSSICRVTGLEVRREAELVIPPKKKSCWSGQSLPGRQWPG